MNFIISLILKIIALSLIGLGLIIVLPSAFILVLFLIIAFTIIGIAVWLDGR